MAADDAGTVADADGAARAAAYGWLAGLLAREPTAAALAVYRTADGRALLAALGELPGLAPLAAALERQVAGDGPLEPVARDLAAAFARAFHGAAGRRSAPPTASVYRDPSGRVMQAQAGAMSRTLGDLGLTLSDTLREPPDHVAVQLSVVAHLLERGADGEAAAFARGHLAPWLDAFAMRCAAVPRADFYGTLARATVDFCRADLARHGGAAP